MPPRRRRMRVLPSRDYDAVPQAMSVKARRSLRKVCQSEQPGRPAGKTLIGVDAATIWRWASGSPRHPAGTTSGVDRPAGPSRPAEQRRGVGTSMLSRKHGDLLRKAEERRRIGESGPLRCPASTTRTGIAGPVYYMIPSRGFKPPRKHCEPMLSNPRVAPGRSHKATTQARRVLGLLQDVGGHAVEGTMPLRKQCEDISRERRSLQRRRRSHNAASQALGGIGRRSNNATPQARRDLIAAVEASNPPRKHGESST